jgi:hypothetical protein
MKNGSGHESVLGSIPGAGSSKKPTHTRRLFRYKKIEIFRKEKEP